MKDEIFSDDLLDFMREIIVADNYRDLAARVLKATASRIEADIATLWRAIEFDGKKKLVLAATYRVEFLPTEKEITYNILPCNTPNDKIKGLTAWIAIKKKPVIADSPEELKGPDQEWAGSHSGAWDESQFWKGKSFGCLIGYPLTLEGKILGVIKFERYSDSKPFSREEKERVQRWSNLIALSLMGMISREEQERLRHESLLELSSKLLVPASKMYYEDIVKITASVLGADICTLWLIDKKKNKLYLAAQFGLHPEAINFAKDYALPVSENVADEDLDGLTVWTFIRNRPFYAHNWDRLSEHSSHKGKWDEVQWNDNPEKEFGCLYAAPLVSEGKPIGVIKVEKRRRKDFQPFNEVERATFDQIALMVSVAPPLRAVIRDKDELVLDYFHILRAPTANAINALDSLRKEFCRKDEGRDERIKARMKMLADNLSVAYTQTLNAFDAATLPADRPSAASGRKLSEVINSSISTLRSLFPESQIILSEALNFYELLQTDFQLKKLNVVIHNIVDNAIAFSNNTPIHIDVAADKNNETLNLSIRDLGVGVSEDIIDQIWNPGVTFRSDAYTRPESRGQGLATVWRIIQEFDWKITFDSKLGKGSTVCIHIKKKDWRSLE